MRIPHLPYWQSFTSRSSTLIENKIGDNTPPCGQYLAVMTYKSWWFWWYASQTLIWLSRMMCIYLLHLPFSMPQVYSSTLRWYFLTSVKRGQSVMSWSFMISYLSEIFLVYRSQLIWIPVIIHLLVLNVDWGQKVCFGYSIATKLVSRS